MTQLLSLANFFSISKILPMQLSPETFPKTHLQIITKATPKFARHLYIYELFVLLALLHPSLSKTGCHKFTRETTLRTYRIYEVTDVFQNFVNLGEVTASSQNDFLRD